MEAGAFLVAFFVPFPASSVFPPPFDPLSAFLRNITFRLLPWRSLFVLRSWVDWLFLTSLRSTHAFSWVPFGPGSGAWDTSNILRVSHPSFLPPVARQSLTSWVKYQHWCSHHFREREREDWHYLGRVKDEQELRVRNQRFRATRQPNYMERCRTTVAKLELLFGFSVKALHMPTPQPLYSLPLVCLF